MVAAGMSSRRFWLYSDARRTIAATRAGRSSVSPLQVGAGAVADRGDTTAIRERVLDARHRAALRGMTRDDTAAAAATELVREADLTAASPRPDSLERGFTEALVGRRTDALPEEHERFAFRFGVALHDVVTIAG
jgi:hypothetical protein